MILIGLTGNAHSGKDAVAEHLRRHHEFFRMAFADPLREGLKTLFGFGDWHFSEGKEEKVVWIGKSTRQLMQSLGTEWGRDLVDQDLWCRHMALRIRQRQGRSVVISDVRFLNEARLILDNGWQIWRISRPGAQTTAHCDHRSEQEQRRIVSHHDLINDGTLEQLFEKVDTIIDALFESMIDCRCAAKYYL